MNITDKFIEELYDLSKKNLTTKEVSFAKMFLLDYIGVSLAGAFMIKNKGLKMLKFLDSKGSSSAIGFSLNLPDQSAIFLNGLSAHVAELDDGVIESSVHPGSPLFSALIPIAQKEKITGNQFLKAIVLGYEAIVRLSNTVQPSHKKKGFHATATCGGIGTAVAISVMMNMSKEEMKNAFSSAIISASGSLKAIEDDSELKPVNVANAALNGYMSFLTALSGFKGPKDAFSGNRGFLKLMSNDYNTDELFKDSKKFTALEKVYIKPYAACRYCHPAIDIILSIKNKIADLNNIKEIQVSTYELAVFNHDHVDINNISSAKMSIPFSVSLALKKGSAGIKDFSLKNIEDKSLAELTKKVKVSSNKLFTENFPKKSQCSIEVILDDGKKITGHIDYPLGEPENPISERELLFKFKSLAEYSGKSNYEIENIIENTLNIEEKINELFPLL